MAVKAGAPRLQDVGLAGPSRNGQQEHLAVVRVTPHTRRELQAVHDRHHEVHSTASGRSALDLFEALKSIGCDSDVRAERFQLECNGRSHVRVIVDDDDGRTSRGYGPPQDASQLVEQRDGFITRQFAQRPTRPAGYTALSLVALELPCGEAPEV